MTVRAHGSGCCSVLAPLGVAIVAICRVAGVRRAGGSRRIIVPSPCVVAQTLVADRALLLGSLGVTMEIALTALALATCSASRSRSCSYKAAGSR